MRRILSALIILAFMLVVPAFAEGTAYSIEEFDISLVIPEGYRLLTPDMDADDPILDIYGISIEDVQAMFEMMPLYMDAVKEDGSGEITVTIQDSDMEDYAQMGATALEMLLPEMTKEFGAMGVEVSSIETYAHPQMPFSRTYFKSEYTMDSGIQYYTVWGGKSYSFTLHNYSGAITGQDEAVMEELIQELRFVLYAPGKHTETEPIEYEDKTNGTRFTVPAGWQRADTDPVAGVEQAAFISTKDRACNIVYVASDLWDDYTAIQKLFSSRKGINNSKFTNHEVGKMIGVSGSDVMRTTINGIEYFSADITQTAAKDGINITVSSKTLLCIQNARAYMFLYTGSPNNGLYADFEALMNSVSYFDAD